MIQRNIARGFAIVLVANLPGFVYDEHSRHSPQLEQVDLLVIQVRHRMLWVGQAGEGERLLFPRALKRAWPIRPDDENLGAPRDKIGIILAQLRQMPAAVRSDKAASEHEHDVLASPVIREADGVALCILKGEIRSGRRLETL